MSCFTYTFLFLQLPQTRSVQGVTGVPIEFNDTLQTLPNMEPSAHRRFVSNNCLCKA